MTSFPKASLIRLVADDGQPSLDLTGRMNGRGAYLCRNVQCLEKAMKKKNVFSSLGISLTVEGKDDFRKRFEGLCSEGEVKEC
jgi:predicted RNA-binding protein YlxR (DUF448 family)